MVIISELLAFVPLDFGLVLADTVGKAGGTAVNKSRYDAHL